MRSRWSLPMAAATASSVTEKGPAETAAFVGPVPISEADAPDLLQQTPRLGEPRVVRPLAHRLLVEPADRRAAHVQRDLVRKLRPRPLLDLQHVAQEFRQITHVRRDVPAFGSVVGRGELVAQVVHAAARRATMWS